MNDPLLNANFSEHPISVLSTYDSYGPTSGSLLTQGGLGVKQSAHIGEQLTVNSVNITPSLGDIIYERQKTLSNNVLVETPIENFIFYNDVTQNFKAIISVDISGVVNKSTLWEIDGTLQTSGWQINTKFTGDITGVRFYISNETENARDFGQINYTNTNTDSTTVIRFRANTLSPPGASNDAQTYSSLPVTLEAVSVDYTPSSENWLSPLPVSLQEATDTLASRLSNIRFQYEYYVSKDGSDSTGNGSMERPYLTISSALTAANNEADSNGVVINISPGQYNENLTIVKPNIALKGSIVGSTKTTRINGSITINPRSSTGGVFTNYYTFENVSIVSNSTHVLGFIGNYNGYIYMKECMLYTSSANVKGLSITSTASMKINIYRCDINMAESANSNAIYIAAGSDVTGSFYKCNIYGRTAPTISIDGSTNIGFNYSYIDNTGSDVVELKNTVVSYFSYCTFTNYQLNANGFNISNATSLVLSHCIFNIPTNVAYNPLNPGSPPATTVGYAVKGPGGLGANIVYGSCLFAPVSVVGASYYWGTKAISNTVNTIQYNTTFSAQA